MDGQNCRNFLEEYFERKFDLLFFIKCGTCSCHIHFNINISNEEVVNCFADFYMKETSKTIKLKYQKKDKQRSIFNEKVIYRRHHDTRYKGTWEIDTVLDKIYFKRFRNTNCPFQIRFKVFNDDADIFLAMYLSNIAIFMHLILLRL